jgi:hypothetical protein
MIDAEEDRSFRLPVSVLRALDDALLVLGDIVASFLSPKVKLSMPGIRQCSISDETGSGEDDLSSEGDGAELERRRSTTGSSSLVKGRLHSF